jgi:hypothetical protein
MARSAILLQQLFTLASWRRLDGELRVSIPMVTTSVVGYDILPNRGLSTVTSLRRRRRDHRGIDAEWQFSQAMPLALYGGYRNTSADGGKASTRSSLAAVHAGGAPMDLWSPPSTVPFGWLGDRSGAQFV